LSDLLLGSLDIKILSSHDFGRISMSRCGHPKLLHDKRRRIGATIVRIMLLAFSMLILTHDEIGSHTFRLWR